MAIKGIREFLQRVEKKTQYNQQDLSKAARVFEKKIPELISKGISPVKGEGRFKKYSDVYRDAIKKGRYPGKRQRPVNLKLTGELLNSLKVETKQNKIIIRFNNPLADIHTNQGAGKSKTIRKMLPQDGEVFSDVIFEEIIKILEEKLDDT